MSEAKIDNANQNEKKEKPFFLKHLFDFIVLVFLIAATSSFYVIRAVQKANMNKSDVLTAVVTFGNEELARYNLTEVTEYREEKIHGKYTDMTLGLKHNAIAVVESGCPGQECVHQHWVSEVNHPIICAYNLIYIEIIGSSWSDVVAG